MAAPRSPARPPASIAERRAERELFFWTAEKVFWAARQTLLIVMLAVLTAYFVVSLVEHELPGTEVLLRYLGQ
jgi:hypothetical protein